MSMIELSDVQAALGRIRDRIYLSPCARSETLSRLTGTSAFLKLENLQMTGAYKERGALNKLLTLSEAERARGLVAASAGNHAQAVAYHGGRLGMKTTIVMPEATPIMKVANTRAHGARVVLHGASYDEAYAEARRLEQAAETDAIVVPVGGGGLISGVAVAAKALRPGVRVIGVETEVLPSMLDALEAGHPVTLEPASTIADGIAVKRAGDLTLEHVKRWVDELVTVSEAAIASALLYLLEKEKTVAEGAGAVAVAALMNR